MSLYKPVVTTERVNDMCGGYIIAHFGALSVLVLAGETPQEAIDRVKNNSKGDNK